MSGSVSYGALIRRNRNFRYLWMGDIVSLFGDWFNTIAIYTLIERLTGSPFALGLVFMVKMGSFAIASPLAGVIADRYDRRRLMIGADLLRAVVVLGLLAVDEASELTLLYGLVALQIAIGSVFRPARSASLPNITAPEELLTANALMATTWSMLLALGAALGGFAASALGIEMVFLLDSATYLLSAWFIYQAEIPGPEVGDAPRAPLHRAAFNELAVGAKYLWRERGVRRISVAKMMWALGGSGLVYMLALLGAELVPSDEAVGIGLLFAARGIGTGIGPIAARAGFRERAQWPRVMGWCVVCSGVFYSLLYGMTWTLWVVLPIAVAHALSGANWVLSSVLLQERAADAVRGRVFAFEWLLLTVTNVLSVLAASLLLEAEWLTLRQAYGVFACLLVAAGVAWLAVVVPAEDRETST